MSGLTLHAGGAPDEREPEPSAERLRLLRRGAANYAGVLLSGAIAVLLVPVLLRGLGADVYALWVTTLAISTMVAGFDFGLGLAVTREVAARSEPDATDFVRSAGSVYVAIGLVGAAIVYVLARSAVAALDLAPTAHSLAGTIVLAGVAFSFLQFLSGYTTAALQGLGRFELLSGITALGALARGAGVIVGVAMGASPVVVLSTYAAVQSAMLLASVVAIVRHDRALAPRLAPPAWNALASRISFSLASQVALLINGFFVETGPILIIGRLLGANALVAFHIAQRIPVALSMIAGSLAQVLFTAAGERANDRDRLRQFAETSTRWMALVILGPSVVLIILAPDLLHAWVGVTAPATILVAQLSLAETYLIGLEEGMLNTLWALGRVRTIAMLMAAAGAPALLFMALSVRSLGIVGAAVGGVLGSSLLLALLLAFGQRALGVGVARLLRETLEPLLLPLAATAAATLVPALLLDGWSAAIVGGTLGGAAFVLSIVVGPARRAFPEIAATIGARLGLARAA